MLSENERIGDSKRHPQEAAAGEFTDRSRPAVRGLLGPAPGVCHQEESQRGSMLVECALLMPVLLIFMFGMVDYSRVFLTAISVASGCLLGPGRRALCGGSWIVQPLAVLRGNASNPGAQPTARRSRLCGDCHYNMVARQQAREYGHSNGLSELQRDGKPGHETRGHPVKFFAVGDPAIVPPQRAQPRREPRRKILRAFCCSLE